MLTTAVSTSTAQAPDEAICRPAGGHHAVWLVGDQERNRHFMEDLLGLPLVAAFTDESSVSPGLKFSHCLYELGDGDTLAFFQMIGPGTEQFTAEHHNCFNQVAFRSDEGTQLQIHERLLAEDYKHFVQDHGWTILLHVTSPDGINIEIAADTSSEEDELAETEHRSAP